MNNKHLREDMEAVRRERYDLLVEKNGLAEQNRQLREDLESSSAAWEQVSRQLIFERKLTKELRVALFRALRAARLRKCAEMGGEV